MYEPVKVGIMGHWCPKKKKKKINKMWFHGIISTLDETYDSWHFLIEKIQADNRQNPIRESP